MTNDQISMRPIKITRGVSTFAHGSCLIEFGNTHVLCTATVDDSVPPWRRGKGVGWVTAEYSMLPTATPTRSRRERSGAKGRTMEIERLIGRSLRTVVDMGAMGGEVTVTVDCDVLQADGGTRTASVTGAYIALMDAFAMWKTAGKISDIPVIGQVAAVSVGMVDGELVLDLNYKQDSRAEVDMNVVCDDKGRFIEVQGTGEQVAFDRTKLNEMLDLAQDGIEKLLELQRASLASDGKVVEG